MAKKRSKPINRIPKLFFSTSCPEYAYRREQWLHVLEDGESAEVFGAKRDWRPGAGFWCAYYSEVGEDTTESCGRGCPGYKPRNGKSGRCTYHGHCYVPSGKYLLTRKGGRILAKKLRLI